MSVQEESASIDGSTMSEMGSVSVREPSDVMSSGPVGTLHRLVLPKKQMLVGEKQCLPSGDCLPSWKGLPLNQKLPSYPAPAGALDLCISKVSKPLYVNKSTDGFDLTDPNNYTIDNSYNTLSDPYMRNYLRGAQVRKRLLQNGEMTPDNKVRCTLRQFNHFRSWLKHVGLMEFHKQEKKEREKQAKLKEIQTDTMDLPSVEAGLHLEAVRQRQLKQREAQQIRRKSQMYELERRMELTRLQREELQTYGTEAIHDRRKHRKEVYDRAARITQQTTRQKLLNYKKKMRRHKQYLKEMEGSGLEETAKRLQDGWDRRKSYDQMYGEKVRHSYDLEEDRAARYRNFFNAEMNRRWREQADRIKERSDRARANRLNMEEIYSRNLARALAGSPVVKRFQKVPAIPTSVPAIPAVEAKGSEEEVPETGEESVLSDTAENVAEVSEEEEFPKQREEEPKIPPFISIHMQEQLGEETPMVVEKPLADMGLNIRLHHIGEGKSAEELRKVNKAIAAVRRQVSASMTTFPGLKKSKKQAIEDQLFESSSSLDQELTYEGGSPEATVDLDSSLYESLTDDEREDMEELINRLLKDLSNGRLDQDDFIRLAAWCTALTQSQLADQTTSTTSLEAAREAKMKALAAASSSDVGLKKDSDSSLSSGVSKYVADTMKRAMMEQELEEDMFGLQLVEATIKNTVNQLTQDLHDGTLSREDVREIGSAVASVILGEVRSDSSVMAEDVLVPTLQHLLEEVKDIDEVLLDHTMASLLSTYNQVTRRLDKFVWQIIRDFVVEVLLRTKVALKKGEMDVDQFLQALEDCKKTPIQQEMDVPRSHELLPVMTTAIAKINDVRSLCPVLCDLMKIILEQGQPILIERDGAEKYSLPNIDLAKLAQMEDSACSLEVALEVAATVSDALYRDLLIDAKFEDTLRNTLSPVFFLTLLCSWGEMTAAVPKETVALQTSANEMAYTPSLAEDIILIACSELWKDALQDRLPCSVIIHLALHLAEFPSLIQLSAVLSHEDRGKVSFPPYVIKKIANLGQMIEKGELDFDEAKKLLAVVLHIYLREVLLQQTSSLPRLVLEDEETVREEVTFLVMQVIRKALSGVQDIVTKKLSKDVPINWAGENTAVSDTLQLMANEGTQELKSNMAKGLTPSQLKDMQLEELITASTMKEDDTDQQTTLCSVQAFLGQVVETVEHQSRSTCQQCTVAKGEVFQAMDDQIRRELGSLAEDVARLFAGMTVLHQQVSETPPVLQKMVSFLVSILLELHSALKNGVLYPEIAFSFLRHVANESCPQEMRSDGKYLCRVILEIVRDIEWKKDRSAYFPRLVKKLSQLSLDDRQHEDVAEGMADTAHVLASVNPDILNKFIQTTLVSLLHSIRARQAGPRTSTSGPSTSGEQDVPSEDRPMSVDTSSGQSPLAEPEESPSEKKRDADSEGSPIQWDDFSSPGRQEQDSSPSRQEQDSSPSRQEEESSPSRQAEDSSPSRQEEDSSPSRQDEDSSPRRLAEDSSPSRQDEDSNPSRQDEDSSPSRQDEDSSPDRRDQDSSLDRQDQDSSPDRRDQDSSPDRRDQDSSPDRQDQDSSPDRRDQDSSPDRRDQDSSPDRGEQDSVPSRQDQDSVPSREDQDSIPDQHDQDSVPDRQDQDSVPAQQDQDSIPAQQDQDSIPAQQDQDSDPSRQDQDSIPAQQDQDSIPAQQDQDSVPAKQDQDSIPAQQDQDSIPAQQDQDSIPAQQDQDSVPSRQDQDSIPAQQDQDSVPGRQDHDTSSQSSGDHDRSPSRQDHDTSSQSSPDKDRDNESPSLQDQDSSPDRQDNDKNPSQDNDGSLTCHDNDSNSSRQDDDRSPVCQDGDTDPHSQLNQSNASCQDKSSNRQDTESTSVSVDNVDEGTCIDYAHHTGGLSIPKCCDEPGSSTDHESRRCSVPKRCTHANCHRCSIAHVIETECEMLDHASRQEIDHETSIIVNMAIQTTLDRLGATTNVPYSRKEDMVTLIRDLDEIAKKSKSAPDRSFADLDPYMVSYAQELLDSVTKQMDSESPSSDQGSKSPIDTGSMAACIINTTLKMVGARLSASTQDQQGTSHSHTNVTPHSSIQDVPLSSLTSCVATTLCAVHSELDVRHQNASRPSSGTEIMSGNLNTLSRAKQVVQLLIDKVQNDWHEAKVEEERLSSSHSASGREVPSVRKNSLTLWESPTPVLSDIILQTFREVVYDMHTQNQFFNPEATDQDRPPVPKDDTFILPSLPFLMDEYILTNLKHVAVRLTKNVPGAESPLHELVPDTLDVAASLRGVVKEIISHKVSPLSCDDMGLDMDGRQNFTLTVLDKAIQRLLDDAYRGTEEHLVTIEESEEGSNKISKEEDTGRSSMDVKKDLNKLRSSLGDALECPGPRTETTRAGSIVDSDNAKHVVVQAFNYILSFVRRDLCTEDGVNTLCETFLSDIPEGSTLESKKKILMEDISHLINAVSSGHILHAKLVQMASEIISLQKNDFGDPQRVAEVMRRICFPSSDVNSEYLKIAVADLLWGLKVERDLPSNLPNAAPAEMQQPAVAETDFETPGTSIARRTVSKVTVGDDSVNREQSHRSLYSSIYSTQVLAQSFSGKSTTSMSMDEGSSVDEKQTRQSTVGKSRVICFEDLDVIKEDETTETVGSTVWDKLSGDLLNVEHSNAFETKERKEDDETVHRTSSESSRTSGSKKDASKDWNRSAVRSTNQSYTSCIDDVQSCESSRTERDALSSGVDDKNPSQKAGATKTKEGKKHPRSAVYSKRVLLRSDMFSLAEYTDRQSKSAMEKGAKPAHEHHKRIRKNRKKASTQQRNNSQGKTVAELEPTTAVQEYSNRVQNNLLTDVDKAPEQVTSDASDTTPVDGTFSATLSCSTTLHSQQNQKGETAEDDGRANCSVNVLKTHSDKSKPETNGSKGIVTPKTLKRDTASSVRQLPLLLRSPIKNKQSHLEERVKRAQQKAFTWGLSLFDPVQKEKRLRELKRRDVQRLRKVMSAAMENTLSNLPQPPVQSQHVVRHPLPYPQPLTSRLPTSLSDAQLNSQSLRGDEGKPPSSSGTGCAAPSSPTKRGKSRTRYAAYTVKDGYGSNKSIVPRQSNTTSTRGGRRPSKKDDLKVSSTSSHHQGSSLSCRRLYEAILQTPDEENTEETEGSCIVGKTDRRTDLPVSSEPTSEHSSRGKLWKSRDTGNSPSRVYHHPQHSPATKHRQTIQDKKTQSYCKANVAVSSSSKMATLPQPPNTPRCTAASKASPRRASKVGLPILPSSATSQPRIPPRNLRRGRDVAKPRIEFPFTSQSQGSTRRSQNCGEAVEQCAGYPTTRTTNSDARLPRAIQPPLNPRLSGQKVPHLVPRAPTGPRITQSSTRRGVTLVRRNHVKAPDVSKTIGQSPSAS